MNKHFVYILFSEVYGKFYIGQTNNLEKRMEEHNKSTNASFTSKYRPWQLYCELSCSNRSVGVRIEKYLKKKPRDFIRRIRKEEDLRNYILERFEES